MRAVAGQIYMAKESFTTKNIDSRKIHTEKEVDKTKVKFRRRHSYKNVDLGWLGIVG